MGVDHCLEVGAVYNIDDVGAAHNVDAAGVVHSVDVAGTSYSVYVVDREDMIGVQICREDIHDICGDDWYHLDAVI